MLLDAATIRRNAGYDSWNFEFRFPRDPMQPDAVVIAEDGSDGLRHIKDLMLNRYKLAEVVMDAGVHDPAGVGLSSHRFVDVEDIDALLAAFIALRGDVEQVNYYVP